MADDAGGKVEEEVADAAAEEAVAPMPRRTLAPGIDVSVLGLGTWQFADPSGTYNKLPEDAPLAIVKAALDSGINLFDTAEGYGGGESERILGKCLAATGVARSDYVVGSKVNNSHLTGGQLAEACDRSLRNLGLETLDLYQIHWPNHEVDVKGVLADMRALVDAGKVRAIGVSNFGKLDLADACAAGIPIATNQLPYSLALRSIEYEIVDVCAKNDVGILSYGSLCQGLLTGKHKSADSMRPGLTRSRLFHHTRSPKARHHEEGCEKELFSLLDGVRECALEHGVPMGQLSLSWAIQQPQVKSVLFGASSPEQVTANAKAASDVLPAALLAKLSAMSEPVKAALGTNPDLVRTAVAVALRCSQAPVGRL